MGPGLRRGDAGEGALRHGLGLSPNLVWGEGEIPHGLGHGPHVLFCVPAKPYTKPCAGQFGTQRRQSRSETSHFEPWQAMKSGDKSAPVPTPVHKRIIRVCGAVKEGSARTNEIVNQGTIRLCAPSAAQGRLPCAQRSPPESPLKGFRQHSCYREEHPYPQGKRQRGFAEKRKRRFKCGATPASAWQGGISPRSERFTGNACPGSGAVWQVRHAQGPGPSFQPILRWRIVF